MAPIRAYLSERDLGVLDIESSAEESKEGRFTGSGICGAGGEVGIVVADDSADNGLGLHLAGLGVGGQDKIANLEVVDRGVSTVDEDDQGASGEAVLTTAASAVASEESP